MIIEDYIDLIVICALSVGFMFGYVVGRSTN